MKDCGKSKGGKKTFDFLPSLEDMDDTRVWKIRLRFADGSSVTWEGEYAFWGTGEQAARAAEFVGKNYSAKNKKVIGWETEREE